LQDKLEISNRELKERNVERIDSKLANLDREVGIIKESSDVILR
jgi:hypothetical protein